MRVFIIFLINYYVQNNNIQYVWFDFHHECRNMKYENLSKLVSEIRDSMKSGSYFSAQFKRKEKAVGYNYF
jgi:hypothetical protein